MSCTFPPVPGYESKLPVILSRGEVRLCSKCGNKDREVMLSEGACMDGPKGPQPTLAASLINSMYTFVHSEER